MRQQYHRGTMWLTSTLRGEVTFSERPPGSPEPPPMAFTATPGADPSAVLGLVVWFVGPGQAEVDVMLDVDFGEHPSTALGGSRYK